MVSWQFIGIVLGIVLLINQFVGVSNLASSVGLVNETNKVNIDKAMEPFQQDVSVQIGSGLLLLVLAFIIGRI